MINDNLSSTPIKLNKLLSRASIPVIVVYENANKGIYSVSGGCYRFEFLNSNLKASGRIPTETFKRTPLADLVEWALMWAESTGHLSEQRKRPIIVDGFIRKPEK